jgi:hypothetical protein
VTDSSGQTTVALTQVQSVIRTLPPVNYAPKAGVALANQSILEDKAWSYTIPSRAFTDANQNEWLKYSASMADGSALPGWLHFDLFTGTFSATPGNEQVGSIDLKVFATDTSGMAASQRFQLTVQNVNDKPVVTGVFGERLAKIGQAFSTTLAADLFADVDVGDVLSYSVTKADGSALPSWLSFDASTRVLSGTPGADDAGDVSYRITAKDIAGASAKMDFHLKVSMADVPVNHAPQLGTALDSLTAQEDQSFYFNVPVGTFTDADEATGDTLTYSATLASGQPLPTWLHFNGATRTFFGTPGNDNVGSLSLTLSATDRNGLTASQSLSLAVLNTNDAPMVSGQLGNPQVSVGQALSFSLPDNLFSDVDAGDTFSWSVTRADGSALPAWLSFDAATHRLSGTPAAGDAGDMALRVQATDPAGASAQLGFGVRINGLVPVAGFDLIADVVASTSEDGSDYAFNPNTEGRYNTLFMSQAQLLAAQSFNGSNAGLTVSGVSAGAHIHSIALTTNASGEQGVSYTLEANYNGIASFDFTVLAPDGQSITAHANVQAVAVNDAPWLWRAGTRGVC